MATRLAALDSLCHGGRLLTYRTHKQGRQLGGDAGLAHSWPRTGGAGGRRPACARSGVEAGGGPGYARPSVATRGGPPARGRSRGGRKSACARSKSMHRQASGSAGRSRLTNFVDLVRYALPKSTSFRAACSSAPGGVAVRVCAVERAGEEPLTPAALSAPPSRPCPAAGRRRRSLCQTASGGPYGARTSRVACP